MGEFEYYGYQIEFKKVDGPKNFLGYPYKVRVRSPNGEITRFTTHANNMKEIEDDAKKHIRWYIMDEKQSKKAESVAQKENEIEERQVDKSIEMKLRNGKLNGETVDVSRYEGRYDVIIYNIVSGHNFVKFYSYKTFKSLHPDFRKFLGSVFPRRHKSARWILGRFEDTLRVYY